MAISSSHQLPLLIIFTQMPQVVEVVVLLWRGLLVPDAMASGVAGSGHLS